MTGNVQKDDAPQKRKRLRFTTPYNLTSRNAWHIRLALWGGALAIGLTATWFALAADKANEVFLHGIAISPWMAFIICPGGLMLVSWLMRRWFPGTEGSGIPQALAALEVSNKSPLRPNVLSIRIAIGKMFLTLIGLCSGASIGREGPTVHVGSSIMFALGRRLKTPPHYLERALILGGGTANVEIGRAHV